MVAASRDALAAALGWVPPGLKDEVEVVGVNSSEIAAEARAKPDAWNT